jgi:hypothetical protein
VTAPDPRPEPVVCGARENRTNGTWECVGRVGHERDNLPHYWVRLVTKAVATW